MSKSKLLAAPLFLLIFLLTACGGGLPKNAILIGTQCAPYLQADYEYVYEWGYDPMKNKFGYFYHNKYVGSHWVDRCENIYTTPTPLPNGGF